MSRLYLITHAHTLQDPTLDARAWRLSAAGRMQVEHLAELPFWAEVGYVVVSSEPKTLLTVEAVIERFGLPVAVDARFDELRRPGWITERAYRERVCAVFAEPEQAAGDWEPAQAALQRVLAGLAALPVTAPVAPGRSVAVVSHGLVLSLLRAHLRGQTSVDFADWQRLGFAAVATIDRDGNRFEQDFSAVTGAPLRGL